MREREREREREPVRRVPALVTALALLLVAAPANAGIVKAPPDRAGKPGRSTVILYGPKGSPSEYLVAWRRAQHLAGGSIAGFIEDHLNMSVFHHNRAVGSAKSAVFLEPLAVTNNCSWLLTLQQEGPGIRVTSESFSDGKINRLVVPSRVRGAAFANHGSDAIITKLLPDNRLHPRNAIAAIALALEGDNVARVLDKRRSLLDRLFGLRRRMPTDDQ